MNQLPSFDGGVKQLKSFWERREGTTGMVLTALAVLFGGYVLYILLPFLLTMFESIFSIALLATGTALLVTAVYYFGPVVAMLFRGLSRWLASWYITVDPIGILKEYVEDLHKNKEKIVTQIQRLKGSMGQLANLIASNQKEIEHNMTLASQARKENKLAQVTLKARKAGRLEDSNVTFAQLKNTLEMLYRVLIKMLEATDYYIEDIEDQVEVVEVKQKAVNAAHGAMQSATDIIRGRSTRAARFRQAMDYLADDYGMKMGEIENMIDMSQDFISTLDLENNAFEASALERIKEWEAKADSLILGDGGKQLLIEASNDPRQEIDFTSFSTREPDLVPIKRSVEEDDDLRELFKKN